MKLLDQIGNELKQGDPVEVDLPFVVGELVRIEDGSIARGILTGDGKPAGQQMPPHVIVKVELTIPLLIQTMPGAPVGQVPVLKIAKPEVSQ